MMKSVSQRPPRAVGLEVATRYASTHVVMSAWEMPPPMTFASSGTATLRRVSARNVSFFVCFFITTTICNPVASGCCHASTHKN